jgi:hypothetical protein
LPSPLQLEEKAEIPIAVAQTFGRHFAMIAANLALEEARLSA